MNPDRPDALADEVARALADVGAPGAAVALVTPEDDRPSVPAGHAGAGSPLAAGARFPIYSITKTLIAAALLTLVDEGRLRLGDEVREYFPELDLPPAVTVRRLLNHTAGLRDYGGMKDYHDALRADPGRPWSSVEFLERTLPDGLLFPPGEGWAYSNVGYLLLRLLLEKLTGESLRRVLHERLFRPLGLTDTAVLESLADTGALTPGFSEFWSPGEPDDVRGRYHPGWVAHGVVASTAPELARLVHAVFTGVFLRAPSLAEMLTPVVVGGEDPVFRLRAYGLGVMIDGRSPFGVVGHGGGGPGYSAGALHFRTHDGRALTGVALVNADRDGAGLGIAARAARALRPDVTGA